MPYFGFCLPPGKGKSYGLCFALLCFLTCFWELKPSNDLWITMNPGPFRCDMVGAQQSCQPGMMCPGIASQAGLVLGWRQCSVQCAHILPTATVSHGKSGRKWKKPTQRCVCNPQFEILTLLGNTPLPAGESGTLSSRGDVSVKCRIIFGSAM